MKLFRASIPLCLFILLLSSPANADQEPGSSDLRAEGRLLLLNGDLAEIGRKAAGYRDTKQRTAAGLWALSDFYDGVAEISAKDPADPRWGKAEQAMLDWHLKDPQSATAIVIYAKLLNKHAWTYRGDGYANTVSAQGGHMFNEYISKAAKFLDANREAGMLDPAWYSERISLANAEGAPKEDLFKLALQGLDKYPTYYPIHFVMANALLPKWGGSFQLIQRYATLAVAHSEMAGEGKQAYARFYFRVSRNSLNEAGAVYAPTVDWQTLKQSLDEIHQAYPDPWTQNLQRVMGCTFGTNVDCRGYLEQLNGKYMSIIWYDTLGWQKDCEDWAFHGKTFDKPAQNTMPASRKIGLYLLLVLFFTMLFAFIDIRSRRLKSERTTPAPTQTAG